MNNFERARFLAKRALAGIDELDVANIFAGEKLSYSDRVQVEIELDKFRRAVADLQEVAGE